MSYRAKLKLAQDAHSFAVKAKECHDALYADCAAPASAARAESGIVDFIRAMVATEQGLKRKADEQTARFDATAVLEAVITHGDQTRKIVVAKPNATLDEPFVSESFYKAICETWDTTDIKTAEDYDIAVVSRKGRIITKIKHT